MIKQFINNITDFEDWYRGRRFDYLSLDTETDGLHYECALKGFSLCDGERACYVNLEGNFDFNKLVTALGIILADSVNTLIGHHIAFDLRVLKYYGINYRGKIYCTQTAAHLLNESASCALKNLAIRVLKVPKEKVWEFGDVVKFGYSSPQFMSYGINDPIWTWELFEITKPLLEKQGLSDLFFNIEMPFQAVLIDLFNNGIQIDREKLVDFENILTEKKATLQRDIVQSIGLKMIEEKDLFGFTTVSSPINIASDEQVAKVIQEKLGINLPRTQPSKTYPKGQPSTASDVLEPLKDKHIFIDLLLKFRKTEKLLNTFITPMKDKIYPDGRIRTSFNNCVARSGRLSSKGPNLQNIPKEFDKAEEVNVRKLFIAKKGYKLIELDNENQELRFLAIISKDVNLLGAFNENKDLHLLTANSCLGLNIQPECIVKTNKRYAETKEKYSKERYIGKNGINFPIVYGSTAYGIAKNNNVSEEVAQGWLDGFFKAYPGVADAMKCCRNEVFRNHCVKNYFGRKRRFDIIDKQAYRVAFNHWIQSSCADVLRISMVAVKKLLDSTPEWDAKLVLTIHDSIMVEIKEQFAEEAAAAIKGAVEGAIKLPLPLPVEVKVGNSYGD